MRIITAFLVLAVSTPATGQEITFLDLVDVLREENVELQQSARRAALADLGYEGVLDAARPRLQASLGPLYGLGTRRGSDFGALESVTDFPPEAETTVTHSTGAGLSLQQLLPTSGSLSGSAGARLDISSTGDDDPIYSLSPSVSVQVAQPLFVAGDVFDARSRDLALRTARIQRDRAGITVRSTENQLVRRLAALYVQAIGAYNSYRLQQRQVALSEERLSSARINAEQGRGAARDVVRQEVALGSARAGLLEVESQLLELEDQIAGVLGRTVSIERLSSRLPTVTTPAATGEDESIMAAQLSLEEAQARVALAERTAGATLSLSVSLSPRYPDERANSDSLLGAVTDFSNGGDDDSEGGGLDVQIAANVEIPILTGRENTIATRQRTLERELAQLDLESAVATVQRRRTLLSRRRDISQRRLALLRDELAFQMDLVTREEDLVEAQSSTVELVEAVELQAEALRNQIWQIEADLFLLDLEIADLNAHTLAGSMVY